MKLMIVGHMADQFHVIRLGVKITVLKVHSKPEIQSQSTNIAFSFHLWLFLSF
ncbi:hypothetical protein MtrunA17_Chr1g0199761 [Medicago truncatula]|uniref:Uncharacterized protein n=1 Tax=Medicago truncatula TaxID=3880 RepID=A0A396JZP0_MEDTR|nr:hypothetical protein MtrunA17_Chr1g0199761 [Medicago truncatula]